MIDKSLLELLEEERLLVGEIRNCNEIENGWLERENDIKYMGFPCRQIAAEYSNRAVDYIRKLARIRKQIKEYFEFIQNSFVDIE